MSAGLIEHLRDLLAPLGAVSFKRMFGGHGIYRDGLMCALVAYDVLYLKADALSSPDFAAEGLGPFVYEGKGKPVSLSYWRCPERCLDDPDDMRQWMDKALAAARRAAAGKVKRGR